MAISLSVLLRFLSFSFRILLPAHGQAAVAGSATPAGDFAFLRPPRAFRAASACGRVHPRFAANRRRSKGARRVNDREIDGDRRDRDRLSTEECQLDSLLDLSSAIAAAEIARVSTLDGYL